MHFALTVRGTLKSKGAEVKEVSAIVVATDLAYVMMKKTQQQVVEETHVPLNHLLDMIELKREFNRRVLRYLGYRRKVSYVRAG